MAQVRESPSSMTNVKLGARGLQNMYCTKWCRISSVNSKEFLEDSLGLVAPFREDYPDVSITRV